MAHRRIGQEALFPRESRRSSLEEIADLIDWSPIEAQLSVVYAAPRAVLTDLDIHIVMDNASDHKTQLIRNWFAKRPRWHVHSTPTGASWLNQVERFFAMLTDQQPRRGVHRSTHELERAIRD